MTTTSMSAPITVSGRVLAAGLTVCCLFFMFAGIAGAEQASKDRMEFIHVVQSDHAFAKTVQGFKEEVAKAGWSVVNVTNMAGMLSKHGFTLDPLMIFDVCSGKYSVQVLSEDAYRPVSAFMPCRVSIYKTSDGKVFVSRMNTGAFEHKMPAEVAKVMAASDAEISEIIDRTVH